MVVVNLLGNSLVCLVVLRDKNMRTTMNFLLVNLAISDMIVGVFSTFRLVFRFLNPSASSVSLSVLYRCLREHRCYARCRLGQA